MSSESELYSDLLAGSYSESSLSSLFSASGAGSFLLIFSLGWFSIGTWGSELFGDTVTSSFAFWVVFCPEALAFAMSGYSLNVYCQ